jgi:glycogen synthase
MRTHLTDLQPCRCRILMTADTIGGVWSYSLDLANELSARGATILLVTFGQLPDHDQRTEATRIQNLQLIESSYPLEWMPDVTDQELERGGAWLLDQADVFKPNVVHLNGYCYGALPWTVPAIVTAHSCVYSWWLSTHGTFPPSSWQGYHQRVSAGIRAASAVVAPSGFMLHALSRIYAHSNRIERVIYNFSSSRQLSVPKEEVILASGRLWDPAKNIQVIERVSGRVPWPIHVAGCATGPNGDYRPCTGLVLLGQLNRIEMARAYSKSSIFLHPAKYEPFGLSVLEAAMNSCALVLSDIPSLRELWGDFALYAHPDDAEQWTEHIIRLTKDAPLRKRLGQKAARCAKVFSPNRAVSDYLALYRSVLATEPDVVEAAV